MSGGGEGGCSPVILAAEPIIAEAANGATTNAMMCVARFQDIFDTSKAASQPYAQFRETLGIAYIDCFENKLNAVLIQFLQDISVIVQISFGDMITSMEQGNINPPLDCIINDVRVTVNTFLSALQAINTKVVQVNDLYQ